MRNFLFTSLFIMLFVSDFYSQNINTDSLKIAIENVKLDTNKVNSLNILAEYYRQNDPDTSIYFANKAEALAKKLNYRIGIAKSYLWMGISYSNLGDYNSALRHLLNALTYSDNKKLSSRIYNNLGLTYHGLSKYPEALKNHFYALKIRQEIKDTIGMANSYGNIGLIYFNIGNYPEALKYHLQSLKIREFIGDNSGISTSYMNIGNVYSYLKNYPKALDNLLLALKIKKSLNDEREVAKCYANIGLVYESLGKYKEALNMHLASQNIAKKMNDNEILASEYNNIATIFVLQKKYDAAIENHLLSLKLSTESGNQQAIEGSYVNLCGLYAVIKKYSEAEAYGKKALIIAKEIGDLEGMKEIYLNLSEVFSSTKRFNEALSSYKNYKLTEDSLLNEKNTQQIVQQQMQYEFDKKENNTKLEQEKKNLIIKEEKRKQQIVIIAVSIGLILVLLLAGVILRNLRINQKKNRIILLQKSAVEQQKILVEEKHKEIKDSINYAERIQRALLASVKALDENLEDYFILFKPKDVVSGDFYWATKLKNNNFVLVIADSTGHGVPGAIMSIVNMASLKEAIVQGILSPDLILNETRRLIIENLKNDGSIEGGKDGMDGSLLSFDFKNKTLHCAAANNPIWIIRDKELIEIKADRMPIGKHDKDKTPFTLHTINLQKGDVVYALTDGFPDQFGGNDGKKFKSKKLQELLLSIAQEPMEIQKQSLNSVFEKWKGDLEQVDDVCLLGVRI